MTKEKERLYHSISEVCKITNIRPHVLRYWESEFKELSPRKNRAGNRIYRNSDIKLILLIKNLLYEERYTIEGAKRKLSRFKENGQLDDVEIVDLKAKEILREIKAELEELYQMLSDANMMELLEKHKKNKS